MSVVVAIKENGIIYAGCDTMVTFGDSKRCLKTEHTQKIWAVEDTPAFIMGSCGSLANMNVVRYCGHNIIPEVDVLKGNYNIGTIIENTVPYLCSMAKDYGTVCNRPEDKISNNEYLLGIEDHLFTIGADGSVEEEEDFAAIGSGADAALASLETTKNEDIGTRLTKALTAATAMSLYVGSPFIYMDNHYCEYVYDPNDLVKVEVEAEEDSV